VVRNVEKTELLEEMASGEPLQSKAPGEAETRILALDGMTNWI
jgi:hypothetical protein